jgi:hypothetical protein
MDFEVRTCTLGSATAIKMTMSMLLELDKDHAVGRSGGMEKEIGWLGWKFSLLCLSSLSLPSLFEKKLCNWCCS